MTIRGTVHVIGVGPGDPELMTLKAARVIAASPVIAYFAKRGQTGHARRIADAHIGPAAEELRLEYPFTTEIHSKDALYSSGITAFYDECTTRLAACLSAGRDVGLLCEGDPFFYGSSLALLDRLGTDFRTVVIPGVTGMSGGWTRAGIPLVRGNAALSVLPGTLDAGRLAERLAVGDATVIMKLGSNLPKVRAALQETDRANEAIYVERGTMPEERILPLAELGETAAPYFSLILVPERRQ
jgi:precorrin-2/cobalt-factor-2 C20-methyltransferase